MDDHTKNLGSAVGGTFIEITLEEDTKVPDNIKANYSQWHTERSSTSKKCKRLNKVIF